MTPRHSRHHGLGEVPGLPLKPEMPEHVTRKKLFHMALRLLQYATEDPISPHSYERDQKKLNNPAHMVTVG